MHITSKVLSLPPFISTSWNRVASIRLQGTLLLITLKNEERIEIPNLQLHVLESIFVAHAAFLEKQQLAEKMASFMPAPLFPVGEGDVPFRLAFSSLDGIGNAMQHNPEQAHTPDLPKEMLEKIASITKILIPEESLGWPKPEPHCNCMHCQIARAIFKEALEEEKREEEETAVSEKDLTFSDWIIESKGEHLYTVKNKLTQETESVYLGSPVGCTCGKTGCEHILAVLRD
jgi:hypothetical protein